VPVAGDDGAGLGGGEGAAGAAGVEDLPAWAEDVVALIGLVSMFAGLGVALAALTMVFKRGNTMTTLVVSVLAVLGGVYFPVSLLPQPFRWLADILPFTWGLDVLRQALLFGKIDVPRLAGMLGAAVIAVPAALVLFWLAVDYARRKGSLTQY